MPIPKEIADLVQAYEFHWAAYHRGQEHYNELQLRTQFIDPFFRALGWDIGNTQHSALKYREVVVNDPINVHGKTLYLDYSFRYGENRKFIVETKKPSAPIEKDAAAALQLRRYAWNEKLSLSILTNFEEFAIYDCTVKPLHGDSAGVARIAYFSYKDYPEKWDEIEKVFSKESIRKGSFDDFAKSTKGKRGTVSVDEDLLSEIEKWRDLLAKNIALRNKLTVNELNTVVQRTIDRILFLKICEDRNIEENGTLLELTNNDIVYSHLCDLFRKADEKYNSGLFHFQKEPGWDELPDALSLILKIDDKILKDIIKDLYPPKSFYLFNIIPPAILGQVYEQFLGKVIRLTESGQAKIEFKPEVKKAGGVFYTPEFIVQYIVQQTVGELVKNKTPREVSKLKILDPACGSGSFLLGAYKYLLDWHIDWYVTNLVPMFKEKGSETDPAVKAMFTESLPRKKGKGSFIEDSFPIYKSGEGDVKIQNYAGWKLKTSEKKRILLNNIFGVDIDPQAVEVTKLSLLLKVLADESSENISKQLKISDERALPSLDLNIKCGNSLVGTDIQIPIEDPDHINPFSWEQEFSDIMNAGGFDAVIGNPPYVRQEGLKEQKKYFETHYAVYQGTADLYAYFIEKGISLLNPNGRFSYIVANKWMKANYGKPLRKYLLTKQIDEIIDFGDLPVFKTATIYPCILSVSNMKPVHKFSACKVTTLNFSSLDDYVIKNCYSIPSSILTEDGWTLENEQIQNVLNKILKIGKPLEEVVQGKIYYGIKTGLNDAFIINEETKNQFVQEDPKNAKLIKPFLIGKDIKRYRELKSNKYLIYLPWHFPLHEDKTITGSSKKAETEFKNDFPVIYRYISQFKTELKQRNLAETEIRYEWYALQRFGASYYKEFEKNKILWPGISSEITAFSLDEKAFFGNDNIQMIISDDKYLLGILNSKISRIFLISICDVVQGGFYRLKITYISKIPIRTINFADPSDKARHDKMVELVTRMLDLNKKMQDSKLEQEKTQFQRLIVATDEDINKLVYELYGLTPDEIKIVEGK